jgi:RNA polymerase sigma-70 factor (ECF subfamily)
MNPEGKTDAFSAGRRPELSDIDLLRRACMEDVSAYEQLVRRYYVRVYQLSYGLTGDRRHAEALASDIFVKAWKALPHHRLSSDFLLWLYRIVVRRAAEYRKTARGKEAGQDDFDPAVKQSQVYIDFWSKGAALRKVSLTDFQKLLNRTLAELPVRDAAILILNGIQKLPEEKLAQVVRCSEQNVPEKVRRASEFFCNTLKAKKDFKILCVGAGPDIERLLELKSYEVIEAERIESNVHSTVRAVRHAHQHPSLLFFPDKSLGWMVAQPRYGIAVLFLIFLGLHLLQQPLPTAPVNPNSGESLPDLPELDEVLTDETNKPPVSVPMPSPLTLPEPFETQSSLR